MRLLEAHGSGLRIGACVTIAELASSETIRNNVRALATSASSLGTPLIRNLATIGGNIGSARPAADLPPPSLLAYGTVVTLIRKDGKRTLPLQDIFTGPGLTEISVLRCTRNSVM
ncbi:MAG: hypothetical protein HKM93_02905 [Desulfobacteraceae bacterium]|nr:hypothetical protein [Desulfobacteraceae bacterium]